MKEALHHSDIRAFSFFGTACAYIDLFFHQIGNLNYLENVIF
jgi:hypothetical protein